MKGKCEMCGKIVARDQIGRHIVECIQGTRNEVLIIRAKGADNPSYWLFAKVRKNATLSDMDAFLRNIWVECCGHMSGFYIKERQYVKPFDKDFVQGDEKPMDAKIIDLLQEKDVFIYEYDFGTTTTLEMDLYKVVHDDSAMRSPVKLLARNEPVRHRCMVCKKNAAWLCSECMYEGNAALCKPCAGKHKCGLDMMLQITNSPRVGMCGYGG